MQQRHSELRDATHLLIQQRLGQRVRLFKRVAGTFFRHNGGRVKPVIDGQADTYGWLVVEDQRPIHWEMEFKVGRDALRPDQIAWQQACLAAGVPHVVIHAESAQDIPAAAQRAVAFLESL